MVDMLDIADVLRAAGVPVVEEDGWKSRGTGGSFEARGVMLHHDASPAGDTSNGVDVIRDGRPGLPGPLSQLWLDFDGRWHIVAAGRANHAGEGSWPGIPTDNGNGYLIGLETDHTTNEHWTADQRYHGLRGLHALAGWLGILGSAQDLYAGMLAHKEWAPDRKVDPDPLDMDDLRAVLLHPPFQGGFVDQIRKKNTVAQVVPADGEWHNVRLSYTGDESGVYGVRPGPYHWLLEAHVTYIHAPAGSVALIRAVNTEGDADHVVAGHPIGQLTSAATHDGDAQHGQYSAQGWTEGGQWLRLQVMTDTEISITRTDTVTTTW